MAEPGGGSPSSEAWQCAAGGKRAVTWKRFSGASEASRVRGNLEMGARGRPSAPAGPWLPAWVPCSRTLEEEYGWGCPECRADPSRSRAGPSPTFSRAAVGPAGPILLCLSGTEASFQLPAVGWSRCPPRRREIASIIPKIPGFSLGWRGSWEKKGGGQGKSLWLLRAQRAWGEGAGGRL